MAEVKKEVESLPVEDEEDKYEDAGELEMTASQDRLHLTRLPKFVWEVLSKLHDEDEICIGTLRVEGDRFNPQRMSLKLDHNAEALKYVPREYNLRASHKSNVNTFVFSEKNLPGYTRRNQAARGSSFLTRQNPQDRSSDGKQRNKGFRPYGFRRAIPKKTALVGHVQSEFTCLPVENDEFSKIMEQRAQHVSRPRHELQLLDDNPNSGAPMSTVALGSNGAFNTFIKGVPQPQKKQQQQKAIRMPKNELRDLLFDCFRSFKYWYIRDLKARTQQPEPWLRECLEDIAELVRQGPHANTWRLKPSSTLDASILESASNLQGFDLAEERVAPTAASYDGASDVPGDEDDDEDDDGNVKMEDVNI